MDGLFGFLESASANSVPSGIVIAGAVLIVGVIIAIAVLRFTAPIGEGAGHAIGKAGDAVGDIGAGVGAIGHGIGRTVGGPGALAEGLAEKWRIQAEGEVETFNLFLTDGVRTIKLDAHGPKTAPQMPQVMQHTPVLEAPKTEVVELLTAPQKKGRKH